MRMHFFEHFCHFKPILLVFKIVLFSFLPTESFKWPSTSSRTTWFQNRYQDVYDTLQLPEKSNRANFLPSYVFTFYLHRCIHSLPNYFPFWSIRERVRFRERKSYCHSRTFRILMSRGFRDRWSLKKSNWGERWTVRERKWIERCTGEDYFSCSKKDCFVSRCEDDWHYE